MKCFLLLKVWQSRWQHTLDEDQLGVLTVAPPDMSLERDEQQSTFFAVPRRIKAPGRLAVRALEARHAGRERLAAVRALPDVGPASGAGHEMKLKSAPLPTSLHDDSATASSHLFAGESNLCQPSCETDATKASPRIPLSRNGRKSGHLCSSAQGLGVLCAPQLLQKRPSISYARCCGDVW